ncbi:MAG: cellulase family glycosylhydrolase [Planctomycetota bacterium]
MKKIGFIKAVIVCALLCFIAPVYASTPWLHTEGNRIKDPMGNVVVLRGVSLIDLGHLDVWQGGALEMIDRLADKADPQGSSPGWYPKVVRVPIVPADASGGWPKRFGPPPADARVYYGLLRPIVDYCKTKDIYVIIDWHYVANTYDHVDTTSDFWTYIAPKFANDSHVLFELFNEPMNDLYGDWIFNDNDTADWLSVRQDMQTWVDIVRTYAPKNLILVAGSNYSQIIKPIVDNPIDGTNIVYVSHIYPGHFLDWWWSDSFNVFSRSYMDEIMTVAAVYPVMMTEWGFTTTSDNLLNGTITEYGQPLMDFIEGLGIGNTAWVASHNWGPPMFDNPDPVGWSNPPGHWPLRCGEGEMGCFVKDTLYQRRNDDQPCDTSQFDIEVTPTAHDFGEVALGTSETFAVSISNTGCGELTITGAGIDTDFAIVLLPPSSAVVQPNEAKQLEISYTPTILGQNSAVLKIYSNDADEPVVEVQLSATGVLIPPSPSQQIADILAFFDEAVEQETIQGTWHGCGGWMNHNDFQVKLMRYMIKTAGFLIEREKYHQACNILRQIHRNCDGQKNPPDTLKGPAVSELANKIEVLMQTLDCK